MVSANDWHLMHLGSFSLGCAGLVCEMTNVNPIGRISSKCAGMYSDDNETALKRVHDFCRTYGVAKLVCAEDDGLPSEVAASIVSEAGAAGKLRRISTLCAQASELVAH
jgi:hypothetical protein